MAPTTNTMNQPKKPAKPKGKHNWKHIGGAASAFLIPFLVILMLPTRGKHPSQAPVVAKNMNPVGPSGPTSPSLDAETRAWIETGGVVLYVYSDKDKDPSFAANQDSASHFASTHASQLGRTGIRVTFTAPIGPSVPSIVSRQNHGWPMVFLIRRTGVRIAEGPSAFNILATAVKMETDSIQRSVDIARKTAGTPKPLGQTPKPKK